MPFIFLSTALLAAGLVLMAVGAWRIHLGRAKARPLMERASVAVIAGIVGWQGLIWLLSEHPTAHQARVLAVWVQCLAGLGIAALVMSHGWIPVTRMQRGRPAGQ